ncbi:MAG: tagaturonate reductase [Bacteroidota bacterium]
MSDFPRLNRQRLRGVDREVYDSLPRPVQVLQFGTGALLRGLVDDALDRAAREGLWRGNAIVVSQTGSGRGAAFNDQDGLFTLRERGMEDGEAVERVRIITTVERAISAQDEWEAVLDLADDADVIVSNTTEVGLTWDDDDDPTAYPPRSFPAKLAALLHKRATAFSAFGREPGWETVVLPTELVEGNGTLLRDLVLRWGERAGWGDLFAGWIDTHVTFCDTLVDRIVTGTPPDLGAAEREVGHRDPLLTDTEPYRLWAIEPPEGTTPEALRERLPFANGDPASGAGIVVAPSVEPFRLRKVRLLNAAHTLLVPVALGCGLETVGEATEDARVGAFLDRLLFGELVPAVAADLEVSGADPDSAEPFARAVRDRFANPFIRHELRSITLQQTMKLGVRAVPSVLALDRLDRVPDAVALGFAAFLLLHRQADGIPPDGALRFATADVLADDRAETIRGLWRERPDAAFVIANEVLANTDLWGYDLTDLPKTGPAFASEVARLTARALDDGLPMVLNAHLSLSPR